MFTILSTLDDRERPKGSRDPLGAEASWSFFGRKIVGNLTTITSNLENFMVALLCCHHAHNQNPIADQARERYLRAEQVAAYLRIAAGANGGILGITRAKRNFEQGKTRLGTVAQAQLLSNQAAYGLWGLYSTALEAADLIHQPDRRVSAAGQVLVDALIGELGVHGWGEFTALASAPELDKPRVAKLAGKFVSTLRSPVLRERVASALLAYQRDCALQQELFPLAQQFVSSNEVHGRKFCTWMLERADISDALAVTMRRIGSLDPLLKLADIIMLWAQTKNEVDLDEMATLLQPCLQELSLGTEWQAESQLPHFGFLKRLHGAACAGNARDALDAVLKQNKSLMKARGGAAWIEADSVGKLKVRVKNDNPQNLSSLKNLKASWRYDYFLYSFLCITHAGQA
ncbi:MAG: hypothetical protein V4857_07725 [Pseudomonadota bacterium]